MASSATEVANLALTYLGENRIEDLAQTTGAAPDLKAVQDIVRRATLRMYEWNFATRRKSLAAAPVQTVWGTLNRFALPTGFLRLIMDDETDTELDWQIESSDDEVLYIVTKDSAPLYIKYIHDVKTPALWDPLFERAYAALWAQAICKKVTGSNQLLGYLQGLADDAVNEAKRIGASEKPAKDSPDGHYIVARR